MTLDEILREIERDAPEALRIKQKPMMLRNLEEALWLRDRARLRSAILALKAAESLWSAWENGGHITSAHKALGDALASLEDVK